jgi:hypothetical protein
MGSNSVKMPSPSFYTKSPNVLAAAQDIAQRAISSFNGLGVYGKFSHYISIIIIGIILYISIFKL